MAKFPPFHPVVARYLNNQRNRRELGVHQLPEYVYGDPGAKIIVHNTGTGQFHYVDAEPVCGDLDWDEERQCWVCYDGEVEGVEFE